MIGLTQLKTTSPPFQNKKQEIKYKIHHHNKPDSSGIRRLILSLVDARQREHLYNSDSTKAF